MDSRAPVDFDTLVLAVFCAATGVKGITPENVDLFLSARRRLRRVVSDLRSEFDKEVL